MDFSLTPEQELLRDSLADWLAHHYDLTESRAGARPEVWRALAEDLGVLGVPGAEEGVGPVETMIVAEELGRALVVEPYVDTVVLAGGVLRRAGAAEAVKGIAAGTVRVAPALLETGHDPREVSTTARWNGAEWVLTGAKSVVPGFAQATHLLVTARHEGGPSLFLVAPDAAGLTAHRYRTIDDRDAADLVLDDVRVPADALLGEEGRGTDLLDPALDEAIAATCAEIVGALRTVLADTVAYAKDRKQFGQPIGSFQALQHRMVDMYIEVEQAVSAVYLATLRLGAEPAERARAVAAAKVTVGRAARFVGQNAVQLHGGMGMTQELAIGHYFKRLTAFEYEYGHADVHRARYAAVTRAH
jgi:alkylation response protein AidB-like acyl-CoA dehydrogenase